MTWTYEPANVGTSARAWIRSRIGDTSSGRQILQDEEIDGTLAVLGDKYYAAARCARMVAASFGMRADKGVGKMRIQASQPSQFFLKLALELEVEAATAGTVTPYAGGISQADKAANAADADRVLPQFTIGMNDLPGIGVSSTSEGF